MKVKKASRGFVTAINFAGALFGRMALQMLKLWITTATKDGFENLLPVASGEQLREEFMLGNFP